MPFLKPQGHGFASLFSVMKDNPSVFFLVKSYILSTKKAHQSGKIHKNFDSSGEILSNFYFDRLLLLKIYKIYARKVYRSYVSWYWRLMQNLKKNKSAISKLTKTWWILIRALSLQNLHFDWSLSYKVDKRWPKKVQRSYFSWRWRVIQNLKKMNVIKNEWEI